MTTPPLDRTHIDTEQRNPRSMRLDQLNVADCVRLINAEDATIAAAVASAAPAITAFIEAVLARMNPNEPHAQASGSPPRLIYFGARDE